MVATIEVSEELRDRFVAHAGVVDAATIQEVDRWLRDVMSL